MYDYNSPQSPILLLLSGGVDPTSDVEALAGEMEVDLIQIALENKNDTVAEVSIFFQSFSLAEDHEVTVIFENILFRKSECRWKVEAG